MRDDLNADTPTNEVDISYSAHSLLEKLAAHQLSPNIINQLLVHAQRYTQAQDAQSALNNDFLRQFYAHIQQWPRLEGIASFAVQVNQLIYFWLNAIQDGAPIRLITQALQCFEIKALWNNQPTEKFHVFLLELLAETLHQHHSAALHHVLRYDANTQLPNATHISSDLEIIMNQAQENQLIGLFSLHFQASRSKLIYSKLVVSELNRKLADTLKQHINANHRLYFSSDSQFDIVIPQLANASQLNVYAAKLTRAFEQMLLLNNQSMLITPYIGCAYTRVGNRAPSVLYLNAKLALDDAIAKQQPFVLFSDELDVQLKNQSNIEAKVIEAFNSDSLALYFQPIVNVTTGRCVGAEMLLRWSNKYGYNIYPSLTIEILNKVGKGKLFTRWLINSACRLASELVQQHQLDLYLTVNLRAEDLYDTELPHLFAQAIALWQLDPQRLILEITENGILEYNNSSTSVIDQLAQQGFRFALDDFGTGFSSLSRLRAMPIDLIKIDQSFVRGMTQSNDDYEIVQSIALLAKSLGKEILAEGVEDKEALDIIQQLQIDKCQGYFFSKPVPFEDFLAWAKAH